VEEEAMKEKVKISSDNIFADLGLDDSDEMRARSDLMSEVVHIIRESGLPQKEIALILGISEPKVSSLMKGKINDFSTDTLMQYLTKVGCKVKISVEAPHRLSRSVKRGFVAVKKHSATKKKPLMRRKRAAKV
jgi:predicted XRE-type DNA-binding protein